MKNLKFQSIIFNIKIILKKNWLMLLCLLMFALITIPNVLNHIPWFDESNAYVVAQNLNFDNYCQYLSFEGHPILWFLVLMPFAKTNFYYPYPMLIINWLFCFLALFVIWQKAPFDKIYKIVITFSYMMLSYYSIYARCYSLGLLILFSAISLYRKQLKHSILYTILLMLAAHTSFLSTVVVIPLILIFLKNIYDKRKYIPKKNIIISLILIITFALLWIIPFSDWQHSGHILANEGHLRTIVDMFIYPKQNIVLGIILVFSYVHLFLNTSKKVQFFLICTVATYFMFFSLIFSAKSHHDLYFLVILIIALWLSPKFYKVNKKNLLFCLCFATVLFFNLDKNFVYSRVGNIEPVIEYLKSQNDKKVVVCNYFELMLLPYLEKNNIQNVILLDDYKLKQNRYITSIVKKQSKNSNANLYIITQDKINDESIYFDVRGEKKTKRESLYITKFQHKKQP